MELFAVFVESSYWVDGDLRSKTNPGHGYPEHSIDYTEVIKFKSEDELKTWIENNNKSYNKKKFEAVIYRPLKVKSTVSIEIE